MTGLNGLRVYLDWNASAPLRPEARAAMLAAMDVVGNPSSVHAEGRAARAIVEKARGQVARLVGCEPSEVVFTSGATEAAAMVLSAAPAHMSMAEHDAVLAHAKGGAILNLLGDGRIEGVDSDDCDYEIFPRHLRTPPGDLREFAACQMANGETGVVQSASSFGATLNLIMCNFNSFSDAAQAAGKVDISETVKWVSAVAISSHKIGGPKGSGALVLRNGVRIDSVPGGGQESGRRSGTENVVGIAGFGAAAEAARRDLEAGVWDRVAHLRDTLEQRLESAATDLIIFGREAPRLPNTSCFAVPGWTGETQVMQMDLAGFAVSAGSACSSGKVKKASRVLLAMGFDEVTASSAIRVSIGPTTTEAEAMAFADAWIDRYRRRNSRAA